MSRVEKTHGEHRVFHDVERGRFFKITHGKDKANAGFALTVDTEFLIGRKTQRYLYKPNLREATPFEYLARLRLFNLIFRDSNVFEGVIANPGQEAIVISQPYINGSAATDEEVATLMTGRGFNEVPGVTAGRPESVSYFRPADQVAVFDTHGQNFLVSGEGIVPIDALLIHASDYLADFLTMTREERIAEVGV
ncbi:MAG: Serine/Threonine/Tyrosine Kinase found in polyvalent protein [Chthoniobacter sp.]|nr:Serine/Threonine/Tyrosine Kinase found in polyvalent protein [Chthoniobacter sp.]